VQTASRLQSVSTSDNCRLDLQQCLEIQNKAMMRLPWGRGAVPNPHREESSLRPPTHLYVESRNASRRLRTALPNFPHRTAGRRLPLETPVPSYRAVHPTAFGTFLSIAAVEQSARRPAFTSTFCSQGRVSRKASATPSQDQVLWLTHTTPGLKIPVLSAGGDHYRTIIPVHLDR
jgi:hypothetical protein